jgi:hypothetical protein
MTNEAENYLQDLGKELLLLARNAQRESAQGTDPFQKGRQTAFYEVLSIMKQQALSFGLDDRIVGLDGVDIDTLLR